MFPRRWQEEGRKRAAKPPADGAHEGASLCYSMIYYDIIVYYTMLYNIIVQYIVTLYYHTMRSADAAISIVGRAKKGG